MAEEKKTKTQKDESAIPPIIDLREPAGSASHAGGSAPAQGGGAPTTGAVAQGTAAPAAKKPAGISLEEQALLDASQTVAPPPEKYTVPSLVKEKFPDLIQLIKETESMNDEERDYWFQILPIMTEEQIKKFRDILLNEKTQLSRLDKEYEEELNRLNEKHMLEWKEFETKEKRKALRAAEEKAEVEEKAAEEELLKRLSQP